MPPTTVCLIGEVLVDVILAPSKSPNVRLGGVMHAARGCWGTGASYALMALCPSYLDGHVARSAQLYGAQPFKKVGEILDCPNVIVVGEPTEAGSQAYELLLRDAARATVDKTVLSRAISESGASEFLIFPGTYDLAEVLRAVSQTGGRAYIDIHYGVADLTVLSALGRKFTGVILSTSSFVFRQVGRGSPLALVQGLLAKYADAVLLKENRGGSRLFVSSGQVQSCPAQVVPVLHSVGVGDCFDAAFVTQRLAHGDQAALGYASFLAAEYASTLNAQAFKAAAQGVMGIPAAEVAEAQGVVLPWEHRPSVNVYLAAPDFREVDRRPLDAVEAALRYHNFSPRRPVKENGELEPGATLEEKRRVAEADLRLLETCQILVAVLLYDDPGTMVEIGLALQQQKPVIVYDPDRRARNPMIVGLANVVTSDLDEVITAVFRQAAVLLRR